MHMLKTIPGFRVLTLFLGATLMVFVGACKQLPTAPAAVVAHTGSISVDSNPTGAAIWLDGTSTGKVTPALLEGLAAANHKLALKKGCRQDEEIIVTVPEDDTLNVFVDMRLAIPVLLEPAPGAMLDNGRTDGKDKIIWDFKWNSIKGASAYRLYVKGANAIYPVIDRTVYGSSYHDESVAYIGDYNRYNWQWKVRAYVGAGWCDWSEPRYFDVEPVNTDPPNS